MKQEYPDLLSENPTFRTNYLGITMNRPIGDNKHEVPNPLGTNAKLRQAINHAVNRQYICDVILEKRGRPANSILPEGMMAHDPNLKGWTYDVAKAKKLLAEAGFPEGNGLPTFNFVYKNDPDIKKLTVAIQADLEKIGIKIELQALDWGAFLERVERIRPIFSTLAGCRLQRSRQLPLLSVPHQTVWLCRQ